MKLRYPSMIPTQTISQEAIRLLSAQTKILYTWLFNVKC